MEPLAKKVLISGNWVAMVFFLHPVHILKTAEPVRFV